MRSPVCCRGSGWVLNLVDPKYARYRASYFLQCLFVTFTMLFALMLLDSVYQTVLITALGSSSCVAFSGPSLRASRPRCPIGGYIVDVVVGCCLSSLAVVAAGWASANEHTIRILLGAVAVESAMFVMAVTDTEHPRADSGGAPESHTAHPRQLTVSRFRLCARDFVSGVTNAVLCKSGAAALLPRKNPR